jgi:hypothetical protein
MSALEPGKARMTHPDPAVDDAIASASQVPHLEHAGWRFVEGDREDWPEDLERSGREGMIYIRHPITGGTAFVPELTPAFRERGWEVVDPDAERVAALEDKKVPELKELAKDLGISPIPTTKDELIEAIEDARQQHNQDTQAGEQPASTEEEPG